MQKDRFEMGQRERDRLKVLHEASRKQITQGQAGEQLGLSDRQIRRLMGKLREVGDRAVIHGLRGRVSNRRISAKVERRAIAELSKPQCRDFGPTYAAEHIGKLLGINIGKDTMRKWMVTAGLWQSRKRQVEQVHCWRERRACFGELVQWDTSVHDWLEGRGERIYLVAMIDDATSRLFARFVWHDSTDENFGVLWQYLEQHGRPLQFYTDKAGLFEVAPKQRSKGAEEPVPLTQITRALVELGISRSSAHSPQAKGRVERCFATAQDRLVKGLRLARARTLEQANEYLETKFLPEWNVRFAMTAANSTDAHRPLRPEHNLAACLSHVETRTITNDYTIQFRGQRFQIARCSVRVGMRGEKVRVEARLDGGLALRYQGEYLLVELCGPSSCTAAEKPSSQPVRKDHNRGGRSSWMRHFQITQSPAVWKAIQQSNAQF
jgi:DNA-binding Lrp family transcriptional regulator